MPGPFSTDLCYDVANHSNHNIWWNTTVVAVLYDDLSSASGGARYQHQQGVTARPMSSLRFCSSPMR